MELQYDKWHYSVAMTVGAAADLEGKVVFFPLVV
jgi:hypothetical protein